MPSTNYVRLPAPGAWWATVVGVLRFVAVPLTMLLAVGAMAGAGVRTSGGRAAVDGAVAGATAVGTVVPPAGTPVRYTPPLSGPVIVLRGFDPPATVYGPGHLGVDLQAAEATAAVLAAGAGRVSFAGAVAGRGVVVVVHPDGVSTEYEPVRAIVHAGQSVQRGQILGSLSGRHPGCPGAVPALGCQAQRGLPRSAEPAPAARTGSPAALVDRSLNPEVHGRGRRPRRPRQLSAARGLAQARGCACS